MAAAAKKAPVALAQQLCDLLSLDSADEFFACLEGQTDAEAFRGTRTTPACGCFGSLHPVLTNCLHCGRLICAEEGYSYCPSCGYLTEKPEPMPTKEEAHKRRLLRFDRENVSRTRVLDDQADYFSNSTSTWLTEEERMESAGKDEEERKEKHERSRAGILDLGAILKG